MLSKIRYTAVPLCIGFMVTFLYAQQILSGSVTLTLSGPATKEESFKAQSMALHNFKAELTQWLETHEEFHVDTNDVAQMISLGMFTDSCRTIAKTESSFQGKELTIVYLLTTDQAAAKLQEYNTMVDKRALEEWNALKEGVAQNDNRIIYPTGIRALYFAMAHLGPPVVNPDSGGRNLADDIHRILQQFFDKMNVTSSGTILAGKTGLAVQNPPSITLLVDSMPFAGVMFTGRLQNGTIIFSSLTDDKGTIVIDNFKIPFVPNGTLLDVCPNPAPLISGATSFIDPALLDIKLNKSQHQAFIFKITRATYLLDYKAVAASAITMPPDFASDAHVKKYLKDSCYLQEGKTNEPIDLRISITAQVSSYAYDETEELGIKVSAEIVVNGLLLQPIRTNRQQFVFEKRYGKYLTPPYGLFFWEANGKLREAIRATIAGL